MTDRPDRRRKIINAEAKAPVVFAPRRTSSARPEHISTRIAFFIAGFGMAAWAPLVPFAKARVGMNDGELGLLLLCLGMGSIVAMPLAGAFVAGLGCRRVITFSALMICLALPLLALVSSIPLLVATLFFFGAGLGAIDVSMNIQAIIVERASGRTMMSGFHGLFSLGGIVGAAGVTALLGAGAAPVTATLVVIACIAVALAKAVPHLLPYGGKSEGPAFALPRGVVLFIGGLCFILFLTEGAVLDWSAVFLASARGVAPSYAGLGYAAFALTMTIGRLSGDRIVQRVGRTNIFVFGGLCAASGFALVALIPSWPMTLIGYSLVGAGCSNVVPVLFTSVGRQTRMAENVAVPAVTGLGYAGILLGPTAIGLVAHAASLSAAFLIVALMLVGVAASGRLLHL
jgi:predicted MFS family arabinose efflux permease